MAFLIAMVWIGGVATAIRHVVGDERLPVPSERAEMLVISADRVCDGGEGEVVYTVSLDGSGLRALTPRGPNGPREEVPGITDGDGPGCVSFVSTGAFVAQHPVWSPGGDRIAYAAARQGPGSDGWRIYVMYADGSGRRELLEADGPLDWSPDGSRLVSPHGSGVLSVDVRTGDRAERELFTDRRRPVFVNGVSWSPDGNRLAVTGDDLVSGFVGRCRGGLFTVQVEGGKPEPFVEPGCYGDPDWSPDGGAIAVTRYRGDEGGSRIVLADAHGVHELASCREEDSCRQATPSWSPDGSRVAFAEEGRIRIVGADGSSRGEVALPPKLWVTQIDWSVVRLAGAAGRG